MRRTKKNDSGDSPALFDLAPYETKVKYQHPDDVDVDVEEPYRPVSSPVISPVSSPVSSPVNSPVIATGELKNRVTGELEYHWVETYPKKNREYFRYCICKGTDVKAAKKIHIPGGNTQTAIARSRAARVGNAIVEGKRPAEICQMISGFRKGKLGKKGTPFN